MDAVAVAHRLGHSSPEVTYRFYAHAINSRDAASAAAINSRDAASAAAMQHYLDAATAPDAVNAPAAQPTAASADGTADTGAKK